LNFETFSGLPLFLLNRHWSSYRLSSVSQVKPQVSPIERYRRLPLVFWVVFKYPCMMNHRGICPNQ